MLDLPEELEAMLTVDCRLVYIEGSFLFGDSGAAGRCLKAILMRRKGARYMLSPKKNLRDLLHSRSQCPWQFWSFISGQAGRLTKVLCHPASQPLAQKLRGL